MKHPPDTTRLNEHHCASPAPDTTRPVNHRSKADLVALKTTSDDGTVQDFLMAINPVSFDKLYRVEAEIGRYNKFSIIE